MRSLSTELAAAHAVSPRKGAECVILAAKDGTRAAFTTWSGPLGVDLGLGAGEDSCQPGINLSAVTLAVGVEAGNFEIDGPATGEFSEVKVRGGKWTGADAWLVRLSPGIAGFAELMQGTVAEDRIEGRRFVFEIRNAADRLHQSWGRVLSPWCTVPFGGAECGVVRTPVACTVTAVTDDFRFTVDLDGDHPDHWFTYGSVAFLTGDLAGIAEARVSGYVGASGAVELFEPLPADPQVGDTLNLFRGCSKLIRSDDATIPTCVSWGNGVNFTGHPEVPGSRVYHRVSAPGASYA